MRLSVEESDTKHLLWLLPFAVFLLILPITHTVALRLLALAGILAATLFIFRPTGFLRQTSLVVPLAVWALLAALSSFYTVDVEYTLGELKNELGYVAIALIGFYGAAQYGRNIDAFLNVLLLSAMVLVVWSLGTYTVESSWPATARYGGVGDYSSYMIYLAPLLVFWGLRNRGVAQLALLSGVMLGLLLSAYLTQNRMFWISLSVELLVLLSVIAVLRRYYRGVFIGFGVLLVCLWFGLSLKAQVGLLDFGFDELRKVVENDPRLSFWPGTIESLFVHPWYGHGFGRSIFDQAHPELALRGYSDFHAHNVFLDAGVQLGIPGMAVLLWVFAALAVRFWEYVRSPEAELRALGIVALVFLAGVISKNMTDNFFIRHHSLFFWSVIGFLLGYGELLKRRYAAARLHQT